MRIRFGSFHLQFMSPLRRTPCTRLGLVAVIYCRKKELPERMSFHEYVLSYPAAFALSTAQFYDLTNSLRFVYYIPYG